MRKHYGRIGCLVFLLGIAPFWYLTARTGATKLTKMHNEMRKEGFEKVEAMIRQGKAEAKIIAPNQIEFTVRISQTWTIDGTPSLDDLVTPEQLVSWVSDWADLKQFRYPLPGQNTVCPGIYKKLGPGYFQVRIIQGDLDFKRTAICARPLIVDQKRINDTVKASLPSFSMTIFPDGDLGNRLVVMSRCHEESPTSVGILIRDCYHDSATRMGACLPLARADIEHIEEEYTLKLLLVVSPVT